VGGRSQRLLMSHMLPKVFQNLLRIGCDGSQPYSFCELLRQAEQGQLKELVGQMDRNLVLDWMKHHGVLCRPQARRICQIALGRLHGMFEEVDRCTASDFDSRCRTWCAAPPPAKSQGRSAWACCRVLMSECGIGG
jgi:hypothetical protein